MSGILRYRPLDTHQEIRMSTVTLNDLCTTITSLGYEATVQEETSQVFFSIRVKETDFPVFARPLENQAFVQLIAFIPGQNSDVTVNDTARLLHMINRELDMPGFCLDEANQVSFYRVLIAVREDKLSATDLQPYLDIFSRVLGTFANLVFAVSQGNLSMKDVVCR